MVVLILLLNRRPGILLTREMVLALEAVQHYKAEIYAMLHIEFCTTCEK